MSSGLLCSAEHCLYNIKHLCSANTIQVRGQEAKSSDGTACGTFTEKTLKNSINGISNMNIPGEINEILNGSNSSLAPEIKCNALKCKYNEQKLCHANSVSIIGQLAETSDSTYCETFYPKH